MGRFLQALVIVAGSGLIAIGAAPGASAQGGGGRNCTTPPGMNYMICDGQRVPKPDNRVANGDGSWREETRQGKCVVIKEKNAAGEYRETRRCDP